MDRSLIGKRFVRAMLIVVTPLLLALPFAGQASAASPAHPAATTLPQVVTWRDAASNVISARALTASEIRARGLSRYIDMSKQKETTPSLTSATAGSSATKGRVTAVKRPAGGVSPAASGCWSTWFGYGTFSGLQLWGKTDVTWCGGGTWVTYATSNCYGSSNYPTYAFLGCSNYPNYGVGWNLYQVKTQWTLCPVYVPIWGSCAYPTYPHEQYQFLGSGKIIYNGGS
jgi:hypothetical protein